MEINAERAASYHRLKNIYLLTSIILNILFLILASQSHWPALPFFLLWRLALWPVRYLSAYSLEKSYGLCRQTIGSWLLDEFKSLLISVALFVIMMEVFYRVISLSPASAWWMLALLSSGFAAFGAAVFPVWILPLFYRITPLQDENIRAAAREVLERSKYPAMPLHVWALGKKSSRANAALTGIGRTRRVILADTLLQGFELPEVQMVLAHELGHHRLWHVWRSIGAGFLSALLGYGLLFWWMGHERLSDRAFLPTLCLIAYIADWITAPFFHALSRAHELEADQYALKLYPRRDVFVSLMDKLFAQNLANPKPSFWEVIFLYTHPPKDRRIADALIFLDKCAPRH